MLEPYADIYVADRRDVIDSLHSVSTTSTVKSIFQSAIQVTAATQTNSAHRYGHDRTEPIDPKILWGDCLAICCDR